MPYNGGDQLCAEILSAKGLKRKKAAKSTNQKI